MKILGIESSCDDTAVALLECSEQGHIIISEATASQINVHSRYGGVIPEIAGRLHAEHITPLIEQVLGKTKPDAIAVTAGPGLITGLVVGVEAARTLAALWNVPLIATNHIDGHIHAVEVGSDEQPSSPIIFPALALVVSGGHTELVFMPERGTYERIGKTKDDAVGECFDKVGKLLGLAYPGGPKISTLAEHGNRQAIDLPRPMHDQPNYDFSFSGLKTAALYYLRDHLLTTESARADFCASFEEAIADVLVHKTMRAVQEFTPTSVLLGGGVAANNHLRKRLAEQLQKQFPETILRLPLPYYTTDNGAMIAVAGYYQTQKNKTTPWQKISVSPQWHVGDIFSE